MAKRFQDTMAFLAEIQNEFYGRWAAALSKDGYTGMLDFSNWQAGRGFSHFYNLESDARSGMIDRHNYFGGMGGFGLGLAPSTTTACWRGRDRECCPPACRRGRLRHGPVGMDSRSAQ